MIPHPPPRLTFWGLIGLLIAVIGLNLALTFHNIWPTPWIRLSEELSVELAALILLAALYTAWRGRVPGFARMLIIVLLIVMIVLRYAEVVAPAIFGRGINIYWDLRHTPRVIEMVAAVTPNWQIMAAVVGLILALLILAGLLWWALAIVSRQLELRSLRRVALLAAVCILGLYTAGMMRRDLDFERWFAIPVSVTYGKQAWALYDLLLAQDIDTRFGPAQPVRSDLARLDGSDVYILFFESYGSTVHQTPDHAAALASHFASTESAIAGAGWQIRSAQVEAPTYGGTSWLSHASLWSGLAIREHGDYQLLLASKRETLVDRFQDAGYSVVALMPGLKQNWPEGEFYGFDYLIGTDALNYRGVAYGWWAIPDQYSLDRLHRIELPKMPDQPRLIYFTSITSHMPFTPLPPYIEDWQDLDAPDAFGNKTPIAEESWAELSRAYTDSIVYDLQVLTGFLEHWAPDDAVIIALGDHQPPAAVSGPDLPWTVPVHIISRKADLLTRFDRAGFAKGWHTDATAIGKTADLHHILLRAFDSRAEMTADPP